MGLVFTQRDDQRPRYHQRWIDPRLPEQRVSCVSSSFPVAFFHFVQLCGCVLCLIHVYICRWTYNQGVVLGGLVELNRASPNKTYLDSAQSIALAAISALTDENDVLHDPCEPNCAPDATQFKGIFIRNLQMLQNVAPQDEYVKVIEACANSIWANDRNSHNQLSVDWSGPFINPANASTHSSALDALVAAISVEQ